MLDTQLALFLPPKIYSISLDFKQDWYSCDFGNVGSRLDNSIFFSWQWKNVLRSGQWLIEKINIQAQKSIKILDYDFPPNSLMSWGILVCQSKGVKSAFIFEEKF